MNFLAETEINAQVQKAVSNASTCKQEYTDYFKTLEHYYEKEKEYKQAFQPHIDLRRKIKEKWTEKSKKRVQSSMEEMKEVNSGSLYDKCVKELAELDKILAEYSKVDSNPQSLVRMNDFTVSELIEIRKYIIKVAKDIQQIKDKDKLKVESLKEIEDLTKVYSEKKDKYKREIKKIQAKLK